MSRLNAPKIVNAFVINNQVYLSIKFVETIPVFNSKSIRFNIFSNFTRKLVNSVQPNIYDCEMSTV